MRSNTLTRRLAAAVGIGATIAMVTLGAACGNNADSQPGSGPDGTTPTTSGTMVSSISGQLSSVISSLMPSN